jgi:hypothetical protein
MPPRNDSPPPPVSPPPVSPPPMPPPPMPPAAAAAIGMRSSKRRAPSTPPGHRYVPPIPALLNSALLNPAARAPDPLYHVFGVADSALLNSAARAPDPLFGVAATGRTVS